MGWLLFFNAVNSRYVERLWPQPTFRRNKFQCLRRPEQQPNLSTKRRRKLGKSCGLLVGHSALRQPRQPNQLGAMAICIGGKVFFQNKGARGKGSLKTEIAFFFPALCSLPLGFDFPHAQQSRRASDINLHHFLQLFAACAHVGDEFVEQVSRIVRAGACFGMVLNGKDRQTAMAKPF